MAVEEDPPMGIPEWVVTFGDMMSLLLTFFIMLVSMSEMKQEERFQAIVESLRKQLGYDSSHNSLSPGDAKPRNSQLAKLATMGRAKRFNTAKGGDKVQAPVGDYPRVRIIRPGSQTGIGTVICFNEQEVELSEKNKLDLQHELEQLGGKPQKIEIRGHAGLRPVPAGSPYRDNWDLAYQRSRNVMEYLVQAGIDRRRIRMGVSGSNEPIYTGIDLEKLKENPRVEVYLLDETVDDLEGLQEEKQQRFAP